MTGSLSRRQRRFLYVMSHVAVLVYVLQLVAIDHWQADLANVEGVVGSSAHVMHCHGDTAGCADGGATALATNMAPEAVVVPPPAVREASHSPYLAASETFISIPSQPPRAA